MSSPAAVILCYHNIVADGTTPEMLEAQLAVARSGFADDLRYLLGRDEVVTFEDIENDHNLRAPLVLTFDDGYRGVLEHAQPLLERYKIPAYVFVNPAFLGGWNPRDKLMGLALHGSPRAVSDVEEFLGVTMGVTDLASRARRFVAWRGPMWRAIARRGASSVTEIEELFERHADEQIVRRLEPSRLLSWSELGALKHDGFRIGNHTLRHLELDMLPREAVRSEVREAQEMCRRHLGGGEPIISYPRGKVNPLVLEEAAAAGYRWGLTAVPGRLRDRRPTLAAPRIVVSPGIGTSGLAWKMSGVRFWLKRQVRRLGA